MSEKRDNPASELQNELLVALEKGSLIRFRQLLDSPKIDPYFRYGKPHFATSIEIASRREHGSDFVRALLSKVKPNVNRIIPEPVHYAAKHGNSDTLAVLLSDKRTKVNAGDSDGQTALHYACMFAKWSRIDNYEQCVELLMEKFSPVDINRADTRGFTAIHLLAKDKRHDRKRKGRDKDSDKDGERDKKGDEAEEEDDESLKRARLRLVETMLKIGGQVLDLDSAKVRRTGRTARDELLVRYPELNGKLPLPFRAERSDPHGALLDAMKDGHIENFRALLQQTDADGNTTMDPNHWFGQPLHATCLELACQNQNGAEFVKALLKAGADPNLPNQRSEKCPVHIACEVGNREVLDALLDDPETYAYLDCVDKLGNTALHSVVAAPFMDGGRKSCLDKLLSRSDFPMNKLNHKQKSALQMALENKNKDAVVMIVTRKSAEVDVGPEMREKILKELPTIKADLLCERPEKRRWLCDDGGICGPKLMNLLKIKRQTEFARRLSEANTERKEKLLNFHDNQNTLLQCAARYGLEEAVFVLLTEGANPNFVFPKNPTPPIVLASQCEYGKVLKIFLDHAHNLDKNAVDARGNTALHHAAKRGNLECVVLLLQGGADWKTRNMMGKTAFMRKDMEILLDKCVTTNEKPPHAEDYEILLDYRLLALPPCSESYVPAEKKQIIGDEIIRKGEEDSASIVLQAFLENEVQPETSDFVFNVELVRCEMPFLSALSKSKHTSDLIQHPVAASFLDLKWQRVKIFAYLNLLMYAFFIVILNIHIVYNSPNLWRMTPRIEETTVAGITPSYDENSTDINPHAASLSDMVEKPVTYFLLLILLLLFCLREVVQCIGDVKNYFKNFENILDWATLLSTWAILVVPDFSYARNLNVLAIMLSCTGLLLLTGRISVFARNIEMLKVVLVNYLMTLVSYVAIIWAFAICFFTLFRDGEEEGLHFQTMTLSLLKVIVMMTGELEANDFPLHSTVFGSVLFVLFVVLVTIVLLNLLIGLAVSDTQRIEEDAEKLKMRSRVQMVAEIEGIIVHVLNQRWLPRRFRALMYGVLLFPPNWQKRKGTLRPNQKPSFELSGEKGKKIDLNYKVVNRLTTLVSCKNKCKQRSLHDVLDEVLSLLKQRPVETTISSVYGSSEDLQSQFSPALTNRDSVMSFGTPSSRRNSVFL